MENKDTSKRHFTISLIKSAFRCAAGTSLLYNYIVLAGVLFIVAEILGVVEEL
jgi:hypothetical protein